MIQSEEILDTLAPANREQENNLVHSLQFLTFTVGEEEYGVDIMTVLEIKAWTDATRLPNTASYMRGVMNLRGLVIPIFDLRARFTGQLTEPTATHVNVILAAGERTVSILADTVSDILSVQKEEIKSAPDADVTVDKAYVKGLISHEKRMVMLLDIPKLFAKSFNDEQTPQHKTNESS
jgi:purine-binding chemotaxis protein CheW